MTLAITSFTPNTGPTDGGTQVVITGTGLDTVDEVMVGAKQAQIVGTPGATTLTLRVPAQAAGAFKIAVIDNDTATEVVSTASFTYAGTSGAPLTPSLARKWATDVDLSGAQDGTQYTRVHGATSLQPAIAQTTQDDSDFDSGEWGSDFVTQLKWSLVLKLDRKYAAGYTEDPGQAALRVAASQTGAESVVRVRWYDRNGGTEAYEGYGIVTWSEDGGTTTAKSSVSCTVMGRGVRLNIDNPAA